MSDDSNQTTANSHKLVAMKPQDRLAYLLRLERSHSLSALIADLGLDASTLYEDKDVRLNLFVGLLHVPVCNDGYPLQADPQAMSQNVVSSAYETQGPLERFSISKIRELRAAAELVKRHFRTEIPNVVYGNKGMH